MLAEGDKKLITWVVAAFNGFLIFASAVGINKIADRAPDTQTGSRSSFRSWY